MRGNTDGKIWDMKDYEYNTKKFCAREMPKILASIQDNKCFCAPECYFMTKYPVQSKAVSQTCKGIFTTAILVSLKKSFSTNMCAEKLYKTV